METNGPPWLTPEEEREVKRRAKSAGNLVKLQILQAAADKFFGLVNAHATSPDVALLAAQTLLDFAAFRRRTRDDGPLRFLD